MTAASRASTYQEKELNTFRKFALATGLCAAGVMGAPTAFAQSTDGFHTIQILPIASDSTSFAQRFTFRNPNSGQINIYVQYFPGGQYPGGVGAIGSPSQTTALVCPSFSVNGNQDRTFTSLRALCPALGAGSQYGFLRMNEMSSTTNQPFAVYSRVSNPQGNGFSVEGFAAKEFTSATSTVSGLRRMAAVANVNPAFQTNCFFGAMDNQTGSAPVNPTISVSVYDNAGAKIGSTTAVTLAPGTLSRMLDIFKTVGAPDGIDYVDARMTYSVSGFQGVMGFCTVQDNTSFGADFRIAKQEVNQGGEGPSLLAAQSDYVSRKTDDQDILTSGGRLATVTHATHTATSNTHVVYFHHPDYVQCTLINENTGLPATAGYGLEMRLLSNNGSTVLAGGNNSVGWGLIYLSAGGDKDDYNFGADGRYTIEVEDNQDSGGAIASARPYSIKCESGSGGTLGEIIRYQEQVDRF